MLAPNVISLPKFSADQQVRFLGGEGKVKSYHPDSGSWFYAVEMALGPEPTVGRIGYETTILLPETDLFAFDGERQRNAAEGLFRDRSLAR
jgi:hypothetical protein